MEWKNGMKNGMEHTQLQLTRVSGTNYLVYPSRAACYLTYLRGFMNKSALAICFCIQAWYCIAFSSGNTCNSFAKSGLWNFVMVMAE